MERREKSFKSIVFVVFIFFFVWILLQFLAPLALPKASITDLSGLTGIRDNTEVIEKMSFPWNYVYLAGDVFCHQKVERTFSINENSMPFCVRCTAIFIGIVIGLAVMIFYKIILDKNFLILVILSLIPIGIDGMGQLFGIWESSTLSRLTTGLLIGIVCGLAVGIIFDEIEMIRYEKIKK